MIKMRTYFLASVLAIAFAACQDDTFDIPVTVGPEGTVPVEVEIEFDNVADGYEIGGSGARSSASVQDANATGFDAQLVPEVKSRNAEDVKPDGIHQLHIVQMKADGSAVGTFYVDGATTTGSHNSITTNLQPIEHCKLFVLARGEGIRAPAVNGTFANVRNQVSQTNFSAIPATGATPSEMNKMPYVLYLEDVNIVQKDGKYIIQSPDGKDVRLRLKRLAAKLTTKWKFSVAGYELEEVRLCQIPKVFHFLPEPEVSDWTTNSYPTLVKEYIDYFRLKGNDLTTNGGKVTQDSEGYINYTTWLPANAKGSAPLATAPIYRNKDIAPTGAGYLEFVAIKKGGSSNEILERIFYRVYLGGKETTDFNILENTNYVWTVNITGADYNKDPRIDKQTTDPVPVNENLKPTSNCFMVQPNSSFCFNPYKHEAGTNGWNDQLVNTETGDVLVNQTTNTSQKITAVKVYWQSKDAGTTGTLVMGYRLAEDDYINQVRLVDNSATDNARVYVRVPYSNGGNALIAAYNANGDIVWSWHLWITNYVPARINAAIGYDDYEPAQQRTLNGTVHKYRSDLWKKGGSYENMVMMDRELGARAGGFPGITKGDNYTVKDAADTQGLLYQWGRKDPFFGSVDGTTNEINVIFDGDGNPKGVTNIARHDNQLENGNRLNYTVKNPLNFIYFWGGSIKSDWWDTANSGTGKDRWNKGNAADPGKKSLYDPSPYGWKVPMRGTTGHSGNDYFTGSIFDGLQEGVGSLSFSNEGDYTLQNANSYFKYAPYCFNGTFYWRDEYSRAPSSTNSNNPKGGRIFFLADDLTLDNKKQWTIHNTFWFPAAAERHPAKSGNLMNPSIGHNWTADYDGNLFCIKPKQIQLTFYAPVYGWSVRCIQDTDVP